MAGLFIFKVMKPEPFSEPRVRAYILNALKDQGERAQRYLEQTVVYWNNPAKFKNRIYYRGGVPIVSAEPDPAPKNIQNDIEADNAQAASIHWIKINDGTTIRHDVMTKGPPIFEPKTTYPGSVGPSSAGPSTNRHGVGGKAYYDPNGREGIRARHWDDLIRVKMQPDFTKKMNEAIAKGLKPK
jgi:hypothetical protein